MNAITQQCLDAHNQYRRQHGAPPMTISNSLMRMAQNWAQTNANSCNMYHSSNRGNIGENLYSAYPTIKNGRVPVDNWYSEIKDYNFGYPVFSMATGHFTQVVWKGSTELGVGWATGSDGWVYFCCNYAPAGNMEGDFEGNVLPQGTACDEPEESSEPEDEDEEAPSEEEDVEADEEASASAEEEEEEPEEVEKEAEKDPPAEDDEAEEEEPEQQEETEEDHPAEEEEAGEGEEEETEPEEDAEGFSVGHVDLDEDYQWARRQDD